MVVPFIDSTASQTLGLEEDNGVVRKLKRRVRVAGLLSTDPTILVEALNNIPSLQYGSFLAIPPSVFAMLVLCKRNPTILDENTVDIDLEYEDFTEGYNQDLSRMIGFNPLPNSVPPLFKIYGRTKTSVQQVKTNFYYAKQPSPAIPLYNPNTAYAVGNLVDYMGFYWIALNPIASGAPKPGAVANGSTGLGGALTFNLGAKGTVGTSTGTAMGVVLAPTPTSLGILTARVKVNNVSSGPPIPVGIVVDNTGPTLDYNGSNLVSSAGTITVTGTGFSLTLADNVLTSRAGNHFGACTAATATTADFLVPGTLPLGELTATIVVAGVSSGPSVRIRNIVESGVESVSEALTTILINESKFTITAAFPVGVTSPGQVPIRFNLGAKGKFTVVSNVGVSTVEFDVKPNAPGVLMMEVGHWVGTTATYTNKPVQVRNVVNVGVPTITQNMATRTKGNPSLTINGTGFNTSAGAATDWKVAVEGVNYQVTILPLPFIKRQIMVGHVFSDGTGSNGPRDEHFPGECKYQSGEVTIPQPQKNYTVQGRIYTNDPSKIADDLIGSISKVAWLGKDPYTWLCTDVTHHPLYIDLLHAFRFEWQYNPDTWLSTAVFNDQRTGRPPANLVSGFGFRNLIHSPDDPVDYNTYFNAIFVP